MEDSNDETRRSEWKVGGLQAQYATINFRANNACRPAHAYLYLVMTKQRASRYWFTGRERLGDPRCINDILIRSEAMPQLILQSPP